ncbi:hypothetical protein [Amycolatopsis sp. 195334CR]|uniref:hypothetical protein n=1 Tax=Amycolatopsis sp. 195334CR TaxID=2814588 RepID=UPI001A9099F6|nr:hypothetical protein [Amycolatopsis sp. 195334CR]MBN6034215.1 hypothetical protein [Amycolatopsis sp. 195334CR]
MVQSTGTAHDVAQTMEVTVDARGKLPTPTAANWGAERLGSLIEQISGLPAPARVGWMTWPLFVEVGPVRTPLRTAIRGSCTL